MRIRLCLILSAVLLIGCQSAVETGHNTALNGIDLTQMTDKMSASILADPDVQRAIASEGPLTVVVQPVVNRMTGEILPRGPADAFTARVRMLLSHQAHSEFTWVMNRDAFYSLRNRELNDVDLGPDPQRLQPHYALTAIFSSLTSEDANRRSSYYLCTYELTQLTSGATLWTDKYEVKKVAVKGFLD